MLTIGDFHFYLRNGSAYTIGGIICKNTPGLVVTVLQVELWTDIKFIQSNCEFVSGCTIKLRSHTSEFNAFCNKKKKNLGLQQIFVLASDDNDTLRSLGT